MGTGVGVSGTRVAVGTAVEVGTSVAVGTSDGGTGVSVAGTDAGIAVGVSGAGTDVEVGGAGSAVGTEVCVGTSVAVGATVGEGSGVGCSTALVTGAGVGTGVAVFSGVDVGGIEAGTVVGTAVGATETVCSCTTVTSEQAPTMAAVASANILAIEVLHQFHFRILNYRPPFTSSVPDLRQRGQYGLCRLFHRLTIMPCESILCPISSVHPSSEAPCLHYLFQIPFSQTSTS